MRLKIVLAALFLTASISALGQVAPAATREAGLPLSVGGGVTLMYLDWGGGRKMIGPVIWADWNLSHMPRILDGLGIEIEGRDIAYEKPASIPRMRQQTFGGGAIYTLRRFQNIHPYGKFLIDYGKLDFKVSNPAYFTDSRTVFVMGGGAEYHLRGHFWVRGDYEYQAWPKLFQGLHTLDPQGITLGASYKFGHRIQP